jgi:hypothetical protein
MPSNPKVVKPDSYKGFIKAGINLNPLSKTTVKFEKFQLPKAFFAEFSLIDWGSKRKSADGGATYSKWFVGLAIEVTDYGTPELLELNIKGSATQDDSEHFRTGFYVGLAKDAHPVAKWQIDFVNQNLNQFTLRAMVEAVSYLKKSKNGWEYHHRESLISDSTRKELARSIDQRLRQTLTPDFIAEVAYIYSHAKLAGTHPTRFVMEHYEVSRITASRWVRKAVDLKMLPEPEGHGKSSNANKKLVRSTTTKEGGK